MDDCDYDYLMQWCWHAGKGGEYAVRDTRSLDRSRGTILQMQDVVAKRHGLVGKVDHKNRNKFDNRFRNLRKATCSQNGANRTKQVNNTSGFKGVTWDKSRKKWKAQLKKNGRMVFQERYPGTKAGKIQAAKAYNKAAVEHFGEFAYQNPL